MRCGWCGTDPLYVEYHDTEWGVPVHDDQKLFEFLILEGAQAGLSWITILRRREGYRKAFHGFNAKRVAAMDASDVTRLMQETGIIRNRLKIQSAITNAQAFLKVQKEFGSFAKYQWGFVGGKPQIHRVKSLSDIQATSEVSDLMSKDMKKRGFKFVGSTILYAHMQAVGMVQDHVVDCFRYKQLC